MLNEDGSLLEISPNKSVGKRDRIEYGKQKNERFRESVTGVVACTCDFNKF